VINDCQDLVFLFSSSLLEPEAQKCYEAMKIKYLNEKVLYLNNVQDFEKRLINRNKTLLVTSATDYKVIFKEFLSNQIIDAIFILQEKQTSLDPEFKSNRKIKTYQKLLQ